MLVTHAPEMCSRADNCELIVYLEDGKVVKTSNAHDLHADASKSGHEHHARDRPKKEQDGDDEQASEENTGVSSGALSWSVYIRYLRQVGSWRFWLFYAVLNTVAHVLMLATGAWTGKWTNAPDRQDRLGYYVRGCDVDDADAGRSASGRSFKSLRASPSPPCTSFSSGAVSAPRVASTTHSSPVCSTRRFAGPS